MNTSIVFILGLLIGAAGAMALFWPAIHGRLIQIEQTVHARLARIEDALRGRQPTPPDQPQPQQPQHPLAG